MEPYLNSPHFSILCWSKIYRFSFRKKIICKHFGIYAPLVNRIVIFLRVLSSENVRRVCNFLSLSCHNKNLGVKGMGASQLSVLQLYVTVQFYLKNKGKYIFEAWGHTDTKDGKRRERENTSTHLHGRERDWPPVLWLLFLCLFSSPWACPM